MPEILSILICHLPERQMLLDDLLNMLEPQCADGRAKVYVDRDGGTIGAKRNRLLAKAQGEYCAFVDDDDMVCGTYVQDILTAVETRPDCVGMSGWYFEGDDMLGMFKHSIEYRVWDDTGKGLARWFRPPNHLNPIKRCWIPTNPFPEVSMAEDRAYSERLLPFLHTEVVIPHPIYQYNRRQGSITSQL